MTATYEKNWKESHGTYRGNTGFVSNLVWQGIDKLPRLAGNAIDFDLLQDETHQKTIVDHVSAGLKKRVKQLKGYDTATWAGKTETQKSMDAMSEFGHTIEAVGTALREEGKEFDENSMARRSAPLRRAYTDNLVTDSGNKYLKLDHADVLFDKDPEYFKNKGIADADELKVKGIEHLIAEYGKVMGRKHQNFLSRN